MGETLACAISYSKKVAVSESREIARVAYLGQITNIESDRGGKLEMERSSEGQGISVRDWARENGCRLKIAQNRTGSIFSPNNEYWKPSRVKIRKGALPGGPGY